MSTCESQQNKENSQVIVRAYGGEPVRLCCVARDGDVVEVSGSDPGKTLALPRQLVISFNQFVFDRLEKAFRTGEPHAIDEAWKAAKTA
jgi:hypothetical protein